jgi:hypothetical protein
LDIRSRNYDHYRMLDGCRRLSVPLPFVLLFGCHWLLPLTSPDAAGDRRGAEVRLDQATEGDAALRDRPADRAGEASADRSKADSSWREEASGR